MPHRRADWARGVLAADETTHRLMSSDMCSALWVVADIREIHNKRVKHHSVVVAKVLM